MLLKLLVVEDDIPTLELMCEVLASFELEIRSESDSEQAAALVNQEKFDGIFLDLMMPRLNGFHLARQIRGSTWNKSTPIVIVTANDDKKTMEEAFKAGATFFLNKPIDRQRLTLLLNSTRGVMLESRRRFRRANVRTEVEVNVGSKSVRRWSTNISERGMLLEADGSLAIGDTVKLSFMLPGQKISIKAGAVVVRVDERKRAGLAFTHYKQSDRQLLRFYIDQLTVNEEKPTGSPAETKAS